MIVLQPLVMLRLGGVLMLRMLLEIVQHVGHSPPGPIQPGIVSLLVAL
jgi:hypothetical protein